jgi:hypothetical protein
MRCLVLPGIQQGDAEAFEIGGVTGGDNEVSVQRGSRD